MGVKKWRTRNEAKGRECGNGEVWRMVPNRVENLRRSSMGCMVKQWDGRRWKDKGGIGGGDEPAGSETGAPIMGGNQG